MRWLIAQTDGTCAWCPHPILVGQEIVLTIDDEYLHAHHIGGRDDDDRT